LLTCPKVIVDQYYQAQLTEMDPICAMQVLEFIYDHDGSFYTQWCFQCEVNAVLTFLISAGLSVHVYMCIYVYMYVCMSECFCMYIIVHMFVIINK
jgi:hypothetical protein